MKKTKRIAQSKTPTTLHRDEAKNGFFSILVSFGLYVLVEISDIVGLDRLVVYLSLNFVFLMNLGYPDLFLIFMDD